MSVRFDFLDLFHYVRRPCFRAPCPWHCSANSRRIAFSASLKFALIFLAALMIPRMQGASAAPERDLPAAWQTYLQEELRLLREEITESPDVIKRVHDANAGNAKLSLKQILTLDKNWQQTEGVDLFISTLLNNGLARKLKEFQKTHRSLVEIFITDERGNLIGSTNKTSDYYQGDETWWQETYQAADPAGFMGSVEYDESTFTHAIPLYLPVFDVTSRKVIGVLKAVSSRKKMLRMRT